MFKGFFTKKNQQAEKNSGVEAITVEQIHKEFNTAADVALASAKAIIAGTDKESIAKAERLKGLGFRSASDVVRTEPEKKKLIESEERAKVISDYSLAFPLYKFISEEDVIRICKKYNLVFGPVSHYTGFVPEKNLREIEKFSINSTYIPYRIAINQIEFSYSTNDAKKEEIRKIAETCPVIIVNKNESVPQYDVSDIFYKRTNFPSGYKHNINRITASVERDSSFKICAPLSDFKKEGMSVKDGFILSPKKHEMKFSQAPDPVVLQRVHGGFLIVTAWGDEASDPIIVNNKMN